MFAGLFWRITVEDKSGCQNQMLLPRPSLNLRSETSAVTSNGKQPERPSRSFNRILPLAHPANVKVGRTVSTLFSPLVVFRRINSR